MIYSIYLITNKVNNKKYVGFTKNPKHRWSQHKCQGKSLTKKPSLINKAIRKYGSENFSFEVISQGKDYDYMLKIMEPHFIKLYKCYGRLGYNRNEGGSSSNSQHKIGFKHSCNSRNKMSQTRKENHLLGITRPHNILKYRLISKQGKIHIINGIYESTKYGLNPCSLKVTLSNGKFIQKGLSRGWKLERLPIDVNGFIPE